MALWATARASSAWAERRPGKLSKVRTSSTSSSRNVAGPPSRPRAVIRKWSEGVERVARPGRGHRRRGGRRAGTERRRAKDRLGAALGRRRDALEVDVLRTVRAELALDAAQTLGAPGAAAADDDGDVWTFAADARPLEQLTIEKHGSRHGRVVIESVPGTVFT